MTAFERIDSDGSALLNIRSELLGSVGNGPGYRYVVWFQGCGHGCLGCWNPGTWSSADVSLCTPAAVAARIHGSGCTGVTFTGGEPLSQPVGFLDLLRRLDVDLLPDGILLFTGHELEEIESDADCRACLDYIDVAVSGRYVRELRSVRGLLGSTNQRLWWNAAEGRGLSRISEASVTDGQVFELHELESGILLTGFPDLDGLHIPGVSRERL